MSTVQKCKNCGSLDIEVDPARGDAVCTNCGSVLEENLIVSEVQFEESARGGSNVIGQFVPSDSKGGISSFGSSFHIGVSVESREITLRKARAGISTLCNQLKLKQQHIDTALNFFKMALARNLTRGRRNTHMQAACVYITCRTEGTPHLLIDISDVLQICCYELGRTYLQVSQALCINIPSMDPCVFIMRFASKLEFGAKTNEVATTALRLVQRMKRDSIHSGRRPSGLCGAALLMAARLHDFNRTTSNIVKIVKIHESTLRKRLIEFSDTPSSALTLDEFLTVDLEEEQDPPSFKAARKKDKERLQKLMNDEEDTLIELKKEIEKELDINSRKRKRTKKIDNQEQLEQSQFIAQSTCETIKDILNEQDVDNPGFLDESMNVELGPNLASMDLACSLDDEVNKPLNTVMTVKEIDNTFDDIDDEELDAYILNEDEVEHKNTLWLQLNSGYLEQQKLKQEKIEKDKEEGKPEKKKRTNYRKKHSAGPSNTAGEAIKKMLQEKKVSSKINYDVLRSLTTKNDPSDGAQETQPSSLNENSISTSFVESPKRRNPTTPSSTNLERRTRVRPTINIKSKKGPTSPRSTNAKTESDTEVSKVSEDKRDHRETETEEELEDDFDDDFEEDPNQEVISDMFGNSHTYDEDDFEVEDY